MALGTHLQFPRAIALLTTGYIVGQILGPRVVGPLLHNGYHAALLLGAAIVLAAAPAAAALRVGIPPRVGAMAEPSPSRNPNSRQRPCENRMMRVTPYVQVDAGIVDANINSMQVFCDSRGIALRRHAKTHKSVDVGRRQLAAGAAGLTVATVGEGEVFADLLAEFGKISLSPTQSQFHRAACGNWLAVCRRSSALTPVTECGERPRQASPYRSRSTPGGGAPASPERRW